MLGFVASGTYRGVKDTRTPLRAAAAAAVTHAVLTPALMFGEAAGDGGTASGVAVADVATVIAALVAAAFAVDAAIRFTQPPPPAASSSYPPVRLVPLPPQQLHLSCRPNTRLSNFPYSY